MTRLERLERAVGSAEFLPKDLRDLLILARAAEDLRTAHPGVFAEQIQNSTREWLEFDAALAKLLLPLGAGDEIERMERVRNIDSGKTVKRDG